VSVRELVYQPEFYSVLNPDTRLSREKYVVHQGFSSPRLFVSYTLHALSASLTNHQLSSSTNVRYLHGGGFSVRRSWRVVVVT